MKNQLDPFPAPWAAISTGDISTATAILLMQVLLPALLALSLTQAPAAFARSKKPDTVIAAPRKDKWWHEKHEKRLEEVRNSRAEIAFFGDSITENMNLNVGLLHKIIGPEASAFGIGGDRTQHLLYRFQNGELNFPAPGPKIFVVLIGTNNISYWKDNPRSKNSDIFLGVEADLKELRKHYPQAKILLLGILPREEKPDGWSRIAANKCNDLLRKLADDRHIFYADIGAVFLRPDGKITKEVMVDFLHPSLEEGYKRMYEAIKAHIDRLKENGFKEKQEPKELSKEAQAEENRQAEESKQVQESKQENSNSD